jgi:CRP-like cAMP-binding protein
MDFSLEQAAGFFFSKVAEMATLSPADKELVIPHLALKKLKKGSCFIREGRVGTEAGLVLQGALRQFYRHNGEEKSTYFFFEGHLICAYISCITGKPSLVSIEALTEVEYVSVPYRTLLQAYAASMAWQQFGRLVAEYQVVGLEQRMATLLFETPEQRYRKMLATGTNKIIERIPQQYIANYLGITPVSMSRIRKRITGKP